MKVINLLFVTALSCSSQVVLAENPFSQAMDTAKDMVDKGSELVKDAADASSEVVKETSDVAKDIADTAQDAAQSSADTLKDIAESATATETESGVISEGGSIVKAATVKKEDVGHLKWSKELINAVETGDAKRGEVLAKKAKCFKCHGDTGISDEDDTPSIAGQISAYSYKQLHDFKVKLRDDRDMLKKVKKLSDQDMMDISAWYATQKPEAMAGDKNSKNIPVLANKGDKTRFLIPCDTCHNEDAMKRGFQTPIIEGQKPEHFIETMTAFKEGDRVNDHYKLMQSIASKLTEDEIKELAAYYAAAPMEEEE